MLFPPVRLPRSLLLLACGCVSVLSAGVAEGSGSSNLLVNGSFEFGNTGFTTAYTASAPGNDSTPGTYAVGTNAQRFNSQLSSFGDHSSGTGSMLLIDGALTPNRIAWSQKVKVAPNTDYEFSGWAASAIATNPGTLRLLVNGSQVRPDFPLPGMAGLWTNFLAVWHSGTNTHATLTLLDMSIVQHGNDFALDDLSFCESSGVSTPTPVMLVAPEAVWKYLDDGSDQGAAWRSANYNDGAWKVGTAQFGYGESDQATVLRSNRTDGTVIQTFYFRKTLYLTNAWAITNLALGLLRDDGGIVYLNGVEVFRNNMTNGPVYSTNWALTAVSGNEESLYYLTNVPSTLLVSGTNVVAVEIHQAPANSTDVSFDFWLSALIYGRPALQVHLANKQMEIAWPSFPGGFVLESAGELSPEALWTVEPSGVVANGTNRVSVPLAAPSRFYRLNHR